jgi:hypothetical protein
VHPDELNPAYIIPSVFHPEVSTVVAAAVKAAVLNAAPEGGTGQAHGQAHGHGPADAGLGEHLDEEREFIG